MTQFTVEVSEDVAKRHKAEAAQSDWAMLTSPSP